MKIEALADRSCPRLLSWAILAWLISPTAMTQTHTRIVGRGDYVFDSGWNDEASFVQIATGDRHTVALRADGSVVAWGANSFGSFYCRHLQRPCLACRTHVRGGRGWMEAHGRASERRLRRRMGRQLLRPDERFGAACWSDVRRSRRRPAAHGRASERRLRRRVGGNSSAVQRPRLARWNHVRGGCGWMAPHGRTPERRLRRRLGVQRLRPVQRPCLTRRSHVRGGRGGSRITVARRSDGASSSGETPTTIRGPHPRYPPGITYVG